MKRYRDLYTARGLRRAGIAAVIALAAAAAVPAQTAEEIVRRLEANQEVGSARSEGTIMIQDRYGTKTNDFESWADTNDQTLIEFTSGEERGQKILRTENEIYLYYPDAEEVIRLQGAALREGVLGSDVSYEDMTESGSLLDDYRVTLAGRETVDGVQTFKLVLEAKRRDIAYPKQTVWVHADEYYPVKAEYYAVSGKLLKEMSVLEVLRTGGKVLPSRTVMQDALKKNSRTEFVLREVEIGIRIDPSIFSLEELSW